jgi:hypothetical protein
MIVCGWEQGWHLGWEHGGSFPGLNGPYLDERFFSKKSLDHTLMKIIDLIYMHNTSQQYIDPLSELVSNTLQYDTMQ